MNRAYLRNRLGIFYAIYLLLFGSVATRMIPVYMNTQYQWVVIALLGIYLILLATEWRLTPRIPGYFFFYSAAQLVIIVYLLFIPYDESPRDYFTNLVLPLAGQAVWNMSEAPARRWVAGLCVFCLVVMLVIYPDSDGLGFGITYIAGCLAASVLIALTLRADRARDETQAVLAELQVANQKLQDYASKVEELAAAEERNRLARDLHDSVSQTIFSMTLTTQAAQILQNRDPERVPSLLDHLQALSQTALSEMRTLIEHLRPAPVLEAGLIAALRKHAIGRKIQDGLDVTLQIRGAAALPEEVEDGVFRIAQEALNNVVKHAGVKCAEVSLDLSGDSVTLTVEDKGAGFTPGPTKGPSSHIGLASMEERVKALGGRLIIESSPGKGTILRVDNIRISNPASQSASVEMAEALSAKEGEA